MPYPIPSEHERRAVFAWLKQAASLTAWRRLYSFHQSFVDAVSKGYEDEQRSPNGPTTIPTDWYADVLRSHDGFAVALQRLGRGDRTCFAYLGIPGHFSFGIQQVKWWQEMFYGWHAGRNGFDLVDSPCWPAIEKSMHECLAVLSEIGIVLQDRVIDETAPISAVSHYLGYPMSSLIKYLVATPVLPAVPTPPKEILISTGDIIPYYGIWEPVRLGKPAVKGTTPKGVPYEMGPSRDVDGRTLDGCLNYLHGDFAAPTIAFDEDLPRHDGRPTTWRLIWRDDRYGDKGIPEEEADYVFIRPVEGEVLFKYG